MIILASSSVRRKQLLEQIGLDFTILPSNIEEIVDPILAPQEQVESFSRQKAAATAKFAQIKDALIIAADTMVVLDDKVIGKPKNREDAVQMLQKLSGRSHQIITAFTLLDQKTQKKVTKSTITTVWIRKLETEEINTFIDREKPYDKAGAYALQELAVIFIERLEGDYAGAIGLPLFSLARELKKFEIEVL